MPLNKFSKRMALLVLAVICIAAFFTMWLTALGESAIMDELAHIPAGYGYVRYLDFRLNPEHPPLTKALSALPLLFLNLDFPTDRAPWLRDVNGQWAAGAQFLYESGNDADQIIRLSRLGPMLLTILLIIVVYLWSRELLGQWWALLPTFLTAFSPHILAHGRYVTTDIAAVFGVVLATHAFLWFLFEPSRKRLLLAGLAFGVAQAGKFSAALLVPYLLFLISVFYIVGVIRDWPGTTIGARAKRFAIRALRYAKSVVIIFAIGYLLIISPLYALFTLNYPQAKQTADTEFILQSFAKGPPPPGESCKPLRCLAELNIWMTKNPVTRPIAHYFLGILMVMQRSAGGNTGYFLGEVSAAGWRHYFPVVYLLKEPLPVLILIFLALGVGLASVFRKIFRYRFPAGRLLFNYLTTSFTEFSMISFVVLYWTYSIASPLNIGFRHLFPALPFIYILTAGVIKRWVTKLDLPAASSIFKTLWLGFKAAFFSSLKCAFVYLMLIWFLLETVFAAPYFLSYFNQLGGGIWGGYRYVTDSNYDWGQDLKRLKEFVEQRPEIDKIAVDYFGGGNPKYYLGDRAESWWSSRGNPSTPSINSGQAGSGQVPPIRWLAVSINTLQGATQTLHPGQPRRPEDEYRWLSALRPPQPGLGNVPEPDYRVGTSIFIYKL